MVTVIKGNKREVPGDMPYGLWWDKVSEYAADQRILDMSYYDSGMEYLTPEELRRMKAKVLIWVEVTGALPLKQQLPIWWEYRMARRRGDMPVGQTSTIGTIDEDGVLHCGNPLCGARWSAPYLDRCKLCDVKFEWED